MGPISVLPIPLDRQLRSVAAAWSIKAWRDTFPADTMQWYLNLYKTGDFNSGLPFTVAAMQGSNLIGIGSLVADDELPNTLEAGPWLAAIFVNPKFRRHGAGTQIVNALLDQAFTLGYREVFGYTESKLSWYQAMGWEFIRDAEVSNHAVAVMRRKLL
jgi:RimJ/RimL family protein N-acetyltransferase